MFSIVICTRERSEQLLKTIELALKFELSEVVVVVNGCDVTINALASLNSRKSK